MAIAGGTADSAVADEDPTEGVQTTYFSFFMHWGQLHVFLLGWGKWKVSARVKSE